MALDQEAQFAPLYDSPHSISFYVSYFSPPVTPLKIYFFLRRPHSEREHKLFCGIIYFLVSSGSQRGGEKLMREKNSEVFEIQELSP